MSEAQIGRFKNLVTTDTAQQHGERNVGDDIERHTYDDVAVYQVTSGRAQLIGADDPIAVLGPSEEHDAVEVQEWEERGWNILADGTSIDHVTTGSRVAEVLQVA